MHDARVFLRSNVILEPLLDRWYAWSYLIPPQTAARNITHRHLPIIDSYLSAPQVHATAIKNPKLAGGPFIDYNGERVQEIEVLKQHTLESCKPLLRLSSEIEELENLLRYEATGHSLQPLYLKIPNALRGLIELSYDLNNRPTYRFIEPLVYRSPYYIDSLQSILISLTSSDVRPFALSTPRLPSNDTITLHMPFSHPNIDFLSSLKFESRLVSEVIERLELGEAEAEIFLNFTTSEPPVPYIPYAGKGARWRYFGHACILLEMPSCSILFDPVVSYDYPNDLHRYTYNDLPHVIDYVVITHNHQDHILLETLIQLRHRVRHLVVPRASGKLQDPSVRLLLEAIGFKKVIELCEMETIEFEGGSLTGIPFLGEHADLEISCKLGYLVRFGSHSLLFAADSCNLEPLLYRHLRAIVGNIEALFLGMECDGAPLSWLYGPLLTKKIDRSADQSRRLSGSNCAQGIQIVEQFDCKSVFVYAMGQEPWLNYIMSVKYTDESNPIVQSNLLLAECRRRGMMAERLYGERELFID